MQKLKGKVVGNTVMLDEAVPQYEGKEVYVVLSTHSIEDFSNMPSMGFDYVVPECVEGVYRGDEELALHREQKYLDVADSRVAYEDIQRIRREAFGELMEYAGTIKGDRDWNKELERVREERYERYKNLG